MFYRNPHDCFLSRWYNCRCFQTAYLSQTYVWGVFYSESSCTLYTCFLDHSRLDRKSPSTSCNCMLSKIKDSDIRYLHNTLSIMKVSRAPLITELGFIRKIFENWWVHIPQHQYLTQLRLHKILLISIHPFDPLYQLNNLCRLLLHLLIVFVHHNPI